MKSAIEMIKEYRESGDLKQLNYKFPNYFYASTFLLLTDKRFSYFGTAKEVIDNSILSNCIVDAGSEGYANYLQGGTVSDARESLATLFTREQVGASNDWHIYIMKPEKKN